MNGNVTHIHFPMANRRGGESYLTTAIVCVGDDSLLQAAVAGLCARYMARAHRILSAPMQATF